MAADRMRASSSANVMRRVITSAFLIGSLAALAACDAPSAPVDVPAYDPTQLTGGLHYRWKSGSTIAIYVDPTGAPPAGLLDAAVQQAMTAWRGVMQFRDVSFRTTSTPADADVILHASVAPLLIVTPPPCPYSFTGAGGYTYFCPAGTPLQPDTALTLALRSGGGRVKIDIRVDRARAASDSQFVAIVVHEMGHALGIGSHSDQPSDVMFGAPTITRPSARDASVLRWVLRRAPDMRF
jgi:predicted Zn-dependent protease